MRDSVETVGSNLGDLLTLFAALMATPAVVAVLWREWYAIPGIVAAAALTGASGRALARAFEPEDPQAVHGIVTAAVGWLLAAVYAALPILFVAWTIAADPAWVRVPAHTPTVAALQSPVNALFEGTSGVTGTGLTMALEEDDLPRSIQWWRSLTQWVGGIGVVVLAAAIAVTSESEALRSLYEERGAVTSLREDTRETIKLVWWIFCLFTFVACVAFWLAGMPLWHALNHAMTGISTGGFVVTGAGIGGYGSPAIEALAAGFMLTGAVSFAVHYALLQGDVEAFLRDAQTRWFLGLAAGAVGVVALLLATVEPTTSAVRYGGFQAVSALTTGGFQTDGSIAEAWPAAGMVVLVAAMVIGGAAGATVGGIKIVRLMALTRGTLAVVGPASRSDGERDVQHEVAEATMGATGSEFDRAAAIALLWVAALATATVVSLTALATGPAKYTVGEVLFEAASAQGNVGLSTGITGPGLPASVKVAFVLSMWIGRLEIVPVLVTARIVLEGVR